MRQMPLKSRQFRSTRRRSTGSAAGNVIVLAGVAGLAVLGNHGTQYDVRQTHYASKEDCLKDWGTEESCSAPNGNGMVFGPRYYWDPRQAGPVVVSPDGTTHPATSARIGAVGSAVGSTALVGVYARGGFGGIGRGFSRGG